MKQGTAQPAYVRWYSIDKRDLTLWHIAGPIWGHTKCGIYYAVGGSKSIKPRTNLCSNCVPVRKATRKTDGQPS